MFQKCTCYSLHIKRVEDLEGKEDSTKIAVVYFSSGRDEVVTKYSNQLTCVCAFVPVSVAGVQ